MPKEILKIHNKLNLLTFKQFTARDYDIFFLVCDKVQGMEKLVEEKDIATADISMDIPYSEITKNSGMWKMSAKELTKELHDVQQKLRMIDYDEFKDDEFDSFVFFQRFAGSTSKRILHVEVYREAVKYLMYIHNKFTPIELNEFVSIESKYAKTLYRLLMMFGDTGELHVKIEKFREVLGVPQAYTTKMMNRDIIDPAVKALQKFFPNLTYDLIRSNRRGRPVVGYDFYFDKIERQITFNSQKDIDEIAKSIKKNSNYTNQKKRSNFDSFEQNDYDYNLLEELLIRQTEDASNSDNSSKEP